jgi:hypothetical protein
MLVTVVSHAILSKAQFSGFLTFFGTDFLFPSSSWFFSCVVPQVFSVRGKVSISAYKAADAGAAKELQLIQLSRTP